MKLPELSESASPEFTDAASCKTWLEHIPLANVAAAQTELANQLEEFNRFPAAAVQRLAVLGKGESLEKLALGEVCVRQACEHFLVPLSRQWCQPKHARSLERRTAS